MTDSHPTPTPAQPRLYVSAAFALSMLDRADLADPWAPRRAPQPITLDQARDLIASAIAAGVPITSVIGHADTAAVMSATLGLDLPASRLGIRLCRADRLLVGQLVTPDGGPYRLPEGATTLPDDAHLEWWVI